MRIEVPKIDGRTQVDTSRDHPIHDLDTGNKIGWLSFNQGISMRPGRRCISLFGRKYIGYFDNHSECFGFAKGVEAVLNHMVSLPKKQSEQDTESTAA
jgi:hypothetical protein